MRLVVVGLIIVAVVIAGATAFLIRNFMRSQEVDIPEPPKIAEILVASANLPAGTAITDDHMTWQAWPDEGLSEAYVVRRADQKTAPQFIGTVVRRGIPKGDPITLDKVAKRDQLGFLAAALRPGMRAVAVRVTAQSSVAGFILPGDLVDIVLTHEAVPQEINREGQEPTDQVPLAVRYTSETVLQNVRVLAIDQKVDDFETQAKTGKTVSLEVTPKQAQKLITARAMGQLTLVLRSLAMSQGDDGEKQNLEPDGADLFTTDVEVSPVLRDLERILAARQAGAEVTAGVGESVVPPPLFTPPPLPTPPESLGAEPEPEPVKPEEPEVMVPEPVLTPPPLPQAPAQVSAVPAPEPAKPEPVLTPPPLPAPPQELASEPAPVKVEPKPVKPKPVVKAKPKPPPRTTVRIYRGVSPSEQVFTGQ